MILSTLNPTAPRSSVQVDGQTSENVLPVGRNSQPENDDSPVRGEDLSDRATILKYPNFY